jgi:hypothetical protein
MTEKIEYIHAAQNDTSSTPAALLRLEGELLLVSADVTFHMECRRRMGYGQKNFQSVQAEIDRRYCDIINDLTPL